MGKTVTILQCPQCKSSHIYYDLGGVTGRVYHCHNCDYIGPVVIELELTEEEVQAIEEEQDAQKATRNLEVRKRRRRRLF